MSSGAKPSSALPEIPVSMRKAIGAYMREASAIQKADPLMAYFCRFYAMQQAIPLIKSSPQAPLFLDALMVQLERDKVALDQRGAALADSKHATEFTLKVFAAADREDRAGRASQNTARTFMAASAFFDVLQQFGALPPDLIDMRKYCKYKAADILKALKGGRKPDVGGPLSAEEKELNAMMAADAAGLPDPDLADVHSPRSSASSSASNTTAATKPLSPRYNSAPAPNTAASNAAKQQPTVNPSSKAVSDDEIAAGSFDLPSVPDTLVGSDVSIAPPDAPSFDDDVSSMLGSMPSVPVGGGHNNHNKNNGGGGTGVSAKSAPPPSVNIVPPSGGPPPAYHAPVAQPPPTQANVNSAAAHTGEVRQMYEAMLRAQSEQMMQLHHEQEKQMQELRLLSERQAAQIAKLVVTQSQNSSSSTTTSTATGGGGGGGRKPSQHSFTSAATAAAMAKHEVAAPEVVTPAVHVAGAVSEPLAQEQIDTAMAFKHAKYIVSALQYDDVTAAFKELKIVAKLLSGADALYLNEPIPKK